MSYRNPLVFFCLVLFTTMVMADDSKRHLQINGMSVYLGVIPAQITQEHPAMHGGSASGEHRYHVLVALFDSRSGKRITDARVKAAVFPLGLARPAKELEAMRGESLSYGNYFTLHKPELYRIRVEIRRGDNGHLSVAEFVFQRPLD
ncbi:hypothetical protein MNBD_GAMMA20-2390 [hydrothermal vent metagenome]|uniref:DUF4426 domain-containing protein n=1 Tax=hydrothermal vent metagenome TaxID=652676 RepID=A0A3B1AL95_9ZZZZ